ncbi:hypothetical protein NKH47_08220 [Mesorhizobium sp. M1060]|uniref:hypothetical protein n=1 Tax=Mesorhizobium sp. M1060 TaxID=2957052 RepID=UPI00333D1B64
MPDLDFLQSISGVLGVAGLGVGVLYLLYRQMLNLQIFEPIGRPGTERTIRLLAILVFVVALACLAAYVAINFVDRGPPREERERNFTAKQQALPAYGNDSFEGASNAILAINDKANESKDSKNTDFWVSLGDLFHKNGEVVNNAYADLSLCFSSSNCSITKDATGERFCSRVGTLLGAGQNVEKILSGLQVGITLAEAGTTPIIPDHVVQLPHLENLTTLQRYCT